MVVLRITHDTPMLESAPPFELQFPSNTLFVTNTGWLWNWLSTRTAPPPMSGPDCSHVLRLKVEFTILKRPPRTKIAPPPPPSVVWPVELPSTKFRF